MCVWQINTINVVNDIQQTSKLRAFKKLIFQGNNFCNDIEPLLNNNLLFLNPLLQFELAELIRLKWKETLSKRDAVIFQIISH